MPQIKDSTITEYSTLLLEHCCTPSRGGNGRALHTHRVKIDGVFYSWLAPGFRRWVYNSDADSFDWAFDSTGKYRNVIRETIRTIDKEGESVMRGERVFKPQMRTARQRPP